MKANMSKIWQPVRLILDFENEEEYLNFKYLLFKNVDVPHLVSSSHSKANFNVLQDIMVKIGKCFDL